MRVRLPHHLFAACKPRSQYSNANSVVLMRKYATARCLMLSHTPYSRTPRLPYSRTPVLPHSLPPVLPDSRTPFLPYSRTPALPDSAASPPRQCAASGPARRPAGPAAPRAGQRAGQRRRRRRRGRWRRSLDAAAAARDALLPLQGVGQHSRAVHQLLRRVVLQANLTLRWVFCFIFSRNPPASPSPPNIEPAACKTMPSLSPLLCPHTSAAQSVPQASCAMHRQRLIQQPSPAPPCDRQSRICTSGCYPHSAALCAQR